MPALRRKMGRPTVDEKGRNYGFYAPPELMRDIEQVMQYTGGTISEFLREAVEKATAAELTKYAQQNIANSTLSQYTGGSIETPKRK